MLGNQSTTVYAMGTLIDLLINAALSCSEENTPKSRRQEVIYTIQDLVDNKVVAQDVPRSHQAFCIVTNPVWKEDKRVPCKGREIGHASRSSSFRVRTGRSPENSAMLRAKVPHWIQHSLYSTKPLCIATSIL